MESVYDVVILFSGGADSILMSKIAEILKLKPYYLLIDYGQLHIEELDFAVQYLRKNQFGVVGTTECTAVSSYGPIEENWTKVKIDLNVNSALTGSGEKALYEGVSQYHVPMRNTIFLSLACSYAESMGIPKVWIGCDYSDREHRFIDCYQDYIISVNELLNVASPVAITVEAPLLGFSKEMVNKILKSYNVDMKTIYSGYGVFA